MSGDQKSYEEMALELELLQARLAEAEETLEAIRNGEVDALFISGAGGDRVYTLECADSAYQALVENMQEGALTLLEDGSILYCNQRFAEIVGHPLENVLGTSFDRFIDPASEADYRALREQGRREKSSGEVQLLLKGGARVPAHLSLNVLRLKELQCISMVVTDLSEQKRNEQIAADERRLRQLAESMPQIVWTARPDGFKDYFNRRWYEFTGLPEIYEGEPSWLSALHPDDAPSYLEHWHEALRTGEAHQSAHRLKGRNGVYRWHLGRVVPVHDEAGRIVRWFGSSTDIEDLKQAELHLLEQAKALAEADRRKDQFLAMLAHELRNPLAPIRYAVQILESVGSKESYLQHQRGIIERQVGHMSRLLDDLLDVSRISLSKIRLQKEKLDLRVVLDQAVEVSRPQINEHHHELTYLRSAAPLWLEGDYARLEQILRNLLNNAVKYTPDGGHIQVELSQERSEQHAETMRAVVRIRDNGIGLSAEMLPRVFEIFTQADQSLYRSQGGLGIGLSMVKNLVEMHGGHVQAASAGPGRGSEFTIWLPMLRPDEIPVALASSAEPSASLGEGVPPRDEALKVLVVDDNLDSACSLSELLDIWGYATHVTHNGLDAIRAALEMQPDVVLLDIGLPGMNGYEVARRMKAEAALEGTLLIALTGCGTEEDRRHAAQAGFHKHFTKPIDLKALRQLLKQMLGAQAEKSR